MRTLRPLGAAALVAIAVSLVPSGASSQTRPLAARLAAVCLLPTRSSSSSPVKAAGSKFKRGPPARCRMGQTIRRP